MILMPNRSLLQKFDMSPYPCPIEIFFIWMSQVANWSDIVQLKASGNRLRDLPDEIDKWAKVLFPVYSNEIRFNLFSSCPGCDPRNPRKFFALTSKDHR